ncbi:signal transduction histidine kinase [Microbacterium resistens]|uniref:Signal transduction histidine kinase n=1 Tax=Microbacterium resistens TaxID=156977 RepID=A0ABU1SHA0_9MICO|nr:sensor histidine kinase [Microbacterium resistens]MDR6868986.1 signal transduction histidine kinase [Microbacterium resistens]
MNESPGTDVSGGATTGADGSRAVPQAQDRALGDPGRMRVLRGARAALHVITVTLTVVAAARAASTGGEMVVVLLAAGVFLAWYGAGASFAHGRAAAWWLAGLVVLWLGALLISPEFVWLSFAVLLLAGHVLRLPWSALLAAVVIAASIVLPMLHPAATSATGIASIIGPLVGGGFAYGISLGYDHLLRSAAERERLIASLLRAQHESARLQEELAGEQREAGALRERTRLARDLHDTIAQELSSIALIARTGDAERMAQIDDLARHSLQELRRIVAALAPVDLEESALAAALGRMLDTLTADNGIRTRLDLDDGLPPLPTPVEVAFLRVAQSGLANVRQHSGARSAEIRLSAGDGVARMEIVDDGSGFDATAGSEPADRRSGGSFGIAAMRSRLRELGGELRIDTAPGEGTRLIAMLPAASTAPAASATKPESEPEAEPESEPEPESERESRGEGRTA